MNQTERYYRIDQLLTERGAVPFVDLMAALEVSRATLKRDLAYLRDRHNAPIVFDRDAGGYRYESGGRVGPRFQLPGLWFSPDEALALLTMHQLLHALDPGGLIGPQVRPLLARLSTLLETGEATAAQMLDRVRVVAGQQRRVQLKWFEVVGKAVVARQRLRIGYFSRHRDEHGSREISPQRLVHYRGNWYLDAWCHRSDGLRMFAVDAIEHAELLTARAKDVAMRRVDQELGAGYGIYRGAPVQWAVLHFSAAAARWVRDEVWHPEQQGRELPGGGWELRLPYAAVNELEMDVLRHGEHVRVVEPAALRARIAERLRAAAAAYEP